MNIQTYKNWKRNVEITKDYQEFSQRLRMNKWTKAETDYQLRLEALIQFHPDQTDRQILNRSALIQIGTNHAINSSST